MITVNVISFRGVEKCGHVLRLKRCPMEFEKRAILDASLVKSNVVTQPLHEGCVNCCELPHVNAVDPELEKKDRGN